MAEAGTLKPDFRALKCRNRVFFLGIPFCTLQRYQKSKNPVGRIDTLSVSYELQNLFSKFGEIISFEKIFKTVAQKFVIRFE